jgi:deazaflavin-dependent oxidoreductase (nitroreductase family)
MVTTIERPNNRFWQFLLLHRFAPRAFALLETTGRRTGARRYTPVANGLTDSTFWLVAAHGTQADYVRNLHANPQVRVKIDTDGAAEPPSCFPTTTRPPVHAPCRINGTRRSDELWPPPR